MSETAVSRWTRRLMGKAPEPSAAQVESERMLDDAKARFVATAEMAHKRLGVPLDIDALAEAICGKATEAHK